MPTRIFDNLDDAIKTAKKRAKTDCRPQFIHFTAQGYNISTKDNHAILKVLFDGTVEQLNQEETAKCS